MPASRTAGGDGVDVALGRGQHGDAAVCGGQGAVRNLGPHRVGDLVVGRRAPEPPGQARGHGAGPDLDLGRVRGLDRDGARRNGRVVGHLRLDGIVGAVQGHTAGQGVSGNGKTGGGRLDGRGFGSRNF